MTATKPTITLDLTDARTCDVGTHTLDGRIVGYLRIGDVLASIELPMLEDIQRRADETLNDHADREEGYDGCAPFCGCGECVPY